MDGVHQNNFRLPFYPSMGLPRTESVAKRTYPSCRLKSFKPNNILHFGIFIQIRLKQKTQTFRSGFCIYIFKYVNSIQTNASIRHQTHHFLMVLGDIILLCAFALVS